MKSKKDKEITDDLIGRADPVCTCAATVVDIIRSKNEAPYKMKKLKALKEALAKKRQQ